MNETIPLGAPWLCFCSLVFAVTVFVAEVLLMSCLSGFIRAVGALHGRLVFYLVAVSLLVSLLVSCWFWRRSPLSRWFPRLVFFFNLVSFARCFVFSPLSVFILFFLVVRLATRKSFTPMVRMASSPTQRHSHFHPVRGCPCCFLFFFRGRGRGFVF